MSYKYGNLISNYPLTQEQIDYINRKGPGYCKTCLTSIQEVWYTFCTVSCASLWHNFYEGISLTKEYNLVFVEKRMGNPYEVDKEMYIKWLEGKTPTIESMETREKIEERVAELLKIQFFAKEELRLLAQHFDKVSGKKGIPPWLKAERDKLITDPNTKVNWDGEPRPKKAKKTKAEREDELKALTGFDMSELAASIKAKKAENNPQTAPKPKPKSASLADTLDFLTKPSQPKIEEPKVSEEEIQSKANSLRERMRARKAE